MQAPRAWYSRIDSYLREMGFQQSEADHNLYFLTGEVPLILVLYVDDLFLTGAERLIGDCKSNLALEFEMKDLGLMLTFWAWRFGREMDASSLDKGSMQ